METLEQQKKDIIYEIEYGYLKNYINNFDERLVKKILCIYVEKLNSIYNLPYNLINNILDEIREIKEEDLEGV